MSDVRRIDISEFREFGYLQEVNRQFLHPLGLALEIMIGDDGAETLGGVWDYREDPEGMNYSPGVIDADKATRVEAERVARAEERQRALGYVVQPVTATE